MSAAAGFGVLKTDTSPTAATPAQIFRARDIALEDSLASVFVQNRTPPDGFSVPLEAGPGPCYDRAVRDQSFTELGNRAFSRGDLAAAMRWYQQALEAERRAGSERSLAVALGNLANVYASMGRREDAEGLYRQVLGIERRLGDERQIALTLLHLGNLAADALEAPRARAYYFEARDLLERLGETGPLGVLHQNLGLLARETGEYADAITAFEAALALMRRAGDRRGVAAVYTNLGRTYHVMGRLDEAFACCSTSQAMAERAGDELAIAAARYHLAGICEARGDRAAAIAHLRIVVDIDRRYHLPKYEENRARLAVLEAAAGPA